jgi:hypothetical protein
VAGAIGHTELERAGADKEGVESFTGSGDAMNTRRN